MSLDKAIASGKEHRKQYRGAKRVDKSCRNHGNHGHGPGNQCPHCLGDRMHNTKMKEEKVKDEMAHAFDESSDYCEGCLDHECLNCPFNTAVANCES